MSPFDPRSQIDALKKYQEMLMRQQQNSFGIAPQSLGLMLGPFQQALGALGGSMGGLGAANYGPVGMLTRPGLGPVRAALPEEMVVEALVGWRRWTVTMFGEELMSNNGTPWKPYKKMAAVCAAGVGCLGPMCGCGIYAYKEREQLENKENAPTNVTHIYGQVSLWGRVIEHKDGFRAQFAYPRTIVNTGGIAERMAYVYGVQIIG